VMDRALALADWAGFPTRRAASERAGRLRGIGLACFLEVAGGILDETVELRFAADGTVALHTGAQPMGQGHLSTFPAVIAARLGIDPAAVRLVQGDSDLVPAGTPSVASRSMMMAGSAAAVACDAAVEKGRRIAAHHFEAAAPDVEFAGGRFRVRGTDRSVDLLQLAARARALPGLPDDLAGGLDSTGKFVSPQMTFPNGCHVTEVEIDPETGRVTVVGYAAVDDVGHIVHETIVEGQIHGGIAQGLGQVLGEHVVYDEAGQLLRSIERMQTSLGTVVAQVRTSADSVATAAGQVAAGKPGGAGYEDVQRSATTVTGDPSIERRPSQPSAPSTRVVTAADPIPLWSAMGSTNWRCRSATRKPRADRTSVTERSLNTR